MGLFGVIDTARSRGLYEMVAAAPGHVCLFAGPLRPPLERVSPYLVDLRTNPALITAWRANWQDHWGILLTSSASLADLRKHFRRFLQAQLPDGQIVMFRFYDPRVFQTYLPTCGGAVLRAWFEGVAEYRVPSLDGGILTFRLNEAGALDAEPRVM